LNPHPYFQVADTRLVGKELYSKLSGYDSISEDASPLKEDAVLKIASATKLMTSVALLQCVDRGLIGLDEPLSHVLPELDDKEIVERKPDSNEISLQPSTIKITPRHLLAHTSGLGYRFLHPLLMKWGASVGRTGLPSNMVTERYNTPLLFEPGNGWQYGSSLDWAGVVVSRLNNGMNLEDYMIENIWKPLQRPAPYPTFHISRHPEYKARLMHVLERTSTGGLQPCQLPVGDNPDDEEGGAGLAMTAADFVGVLQDLISDSPRLLKPETVRKMFEPQLARDGPAIPMLLQLKPAWDMVAGPVDETTVNHGLGGILLQGEAPDIGQPANLLAWGGASNVVWFASKELGVAGFFGTQLSPFGDAVVKKLVNAWKRDFWGGFSKI
jgi:CubicO group peptidase (beta-lactamase class C family)